MFLSINEELNTADRRAKNRVDTKPEFNLAGIDFIIQPVE